MNKKISLQWKLTFLTALLVSVACTALSFFISSSALSSFSEIENSVIAIFPTDDFFEAYAGDAGFNFDYPTEIAGQIQAVQIDFWVKSLFVTFIISSTSSFLTYFIVGYSLRPLKKFSEQIEIVQVQNMQQPIDVKTTDKEIMRLEDSFNSMLERLDKAFLVQKQFSANAAHELRTPLAIIRTKLEVFKKQGEKTDENCLELMDMIYIQTEKFSHVIDVLLEMTELHAVKKNELVSLSPLVEEVICDLTPLGDKSGIALTQKGCDVNICGSDTLIYRAIYNLVENAIKYNIPNGNVTVEVAEDDAFARVSVTDSGIGINPNDCTMVFEPFYQVDKSRNSAVGGVGLGLALVKEIANQHGGDVSILNSSPQGTSIEFTIGKNNTMINTPPSNGI